MGEKVVTWYGATSGRVTGVLGLVAAGVIVVLGVVDAHVPGVVAGLLVGLLSWLVLLRPKVGASATELHLRGIVSTVIIPLASVESVTVRQVLAVWAGGHRHVSAAVGHTFRDINRQRRGGGHVEEVGVPEHKYADQIRELLTERSRAARRDGAPMGPVRREWAWPEIGAVLVLVVALVVTILV